ncbi:MAG: hypothetical protein PWQ44_790 [Methanolobus sp.]|jgi:hypothetical protein|nr:hypothetical protein [Methanolobus sp.]
MQTMYLLLNLSDYSYEKRIAGDTKIPDVFENNV